MAVECRVADAAAGTALAGALADYDDAESRLAVTAERSLLARLEAGCSAPVGALARVEAGNLVLKAVVCSPDGSRLLHGEQQVPAAGSEDAVALGARLAEELLGRGAGDLMSQAGH